MGRRGQGGETERERERRRKAHYERRRSVSSLVASAYTRFLPSLSSSLLAFKLPQEAGCLSATYLPSSRYLYDGSSY